MSVRPLRIPGAVLIECDRAVDRRGRFDTFWESADFHAAGVRFSPQSGHHAHTERAATLRGMHYQRAPHAQARLVACASGRVWDVVLDLRRDSPTYLQWEGTELEPLAGHALFVPRGCAHGYVTLEDRSTVTYLIEGAYEPRAAAVVRWNDPAVRIAWPVSEPILSDRDRTAPDFVP